MKKSQERAHQPLSVFVGSLLRVHMCHSSAQMFITTESSELAVYEACFGGISELV